MKRFAAFTLILAMLIVSGCAISRTPTRDKIALIAPFEGRDREIGYEALYAARLALVDAGSPYDLLPIDDGGTPFTAVDRARALTHDPAVQAVILAGANTTANEIIGILAAIPTQIITETRPLDPEFAQRYSESAEFAPPPTDFAMWTYDAVFVLLPMRSTS